MRATHTGLSPPTRGILKQGERVSRAERSIPAYAGDPPKRFRLHACHRVYPRLRGGSSWRATQPSHRQGLSPPTRGIRAHPRPRGGGGGSIPAYAGDPCQSAAAFAILTVYPRLRGGSVNWQCWAQSGCGLSPPTRGIRLRIALFGALDRSIPAYAGDPPIAGAASNKRQVYPRLRGGSECGAHRLQAGAGLSPPTRGIPKPILYTRLTKGSIPAYAGDPSRLYQCLSPNEVYPRLRGGSSHRCLWRKRQRGLSPPTRGIPKLPLKTLDNYWSIPAYAGDPEARRRRG